MKLTRNRSICFCLVIVLIVVCCILTNHNVCGNVYAEQSLVDLANDSSISYESIYIFVPTGDTECSVRLSDKTIDKAIIPASAVIDGKEYTVTSIAGNGFASANNLTKVRLPKTIKTIGNAAFANCKKLNSITLNKVESIGTNAFNLCTSLQYLILPSTINTVSPTILRNCNTQVYVRASENEVQEEQWATNWNELNANQSVEFDSKYTPDVEYIELYNTHMRSTDKEIVGYYVADDQPFREERDDEVYVYIPEIYNGQPVVGISDSAFAYNAISYLTIGYADTPIHIDSYAFNGLEGKSITINRDINIDVTNWQGKESLAEYLFADSAVSTILLPKSIESIGSYMFNGCRELKDIGFITPTSMEDKTQEEDIVNQFTSTGIVNLPDSLSVIGTEAFSGLTNISEIHIPKSVVSVGESVFIEWVYPQLISIAYEKESDLPWDANAMEGWNPNWKNNCSKEVIQFSGEYSIDYELNGGKNSVENPEKYTSRDKIELKDATRTGYTFVGWYDNSSFNGEQIKSIERGRSGDLVLYAKWTPNIYEVIYNSNKPLYASNSISGVMANTKLVYDTMSNLSDNVYLLEGWTFVDWNTNADGSGTKYINGQEIANLTSQSDGQIYLYAQWQRNSYAVIYHNNKPNNASDELFGTMQNSVHNYDILKNLSPNQFELLGWSFVGWNTQTDGNGTSFINEQEVKNLSSYDGDEITLFAQWVPNSYTIQYLSNKPVNASQPLEGQTVSSLHKYDFIENLSSNAYSLLGWKFVGWNTKADGSGNWYTNAEKVKNITSINRDSISLYAQWTPNIYYIEYIDNVPALASGSISGAMSYSIHTYDTQKTLTANGYSLPGWKFTAWNTKADGSGVEYSSSEKILNITSTDGDIIKLYACWSVNKYKINYHGNKPINATSELIGTVQSSSAVYESTVILALNGFSLSGWNFVAWNTKADGSGIKYYEGESVENITITEEIVLYAQWSPDKYTIVYYANKPSSSSQPMVGNMSDSKYDYDTPTTLPQNKFSMRGYQFMGWSKSPSGTVNYLDEGKISIGVSNGDRIELYATWKVIQYTITMKDIDTNKTSTYHKTYSVEDEEMVFEDYCLGGYYTTYYTHRIEKGSTGDKVIEYKRTQITYTFVVRYAGAGKVLAPEERYELKYEEEKTISAPNISGYTFKYFSHPKGVYIPPTPGGNQDIPIEDLFDIYPNQTTTFSRLTKIPGEAFEVTAVYELIPTINPGPEESKCVASGTMITLADGTQRAVETLTGNESLLVWNLLTGNFDVASILFIDNDPAKEYEVINLYFSDGTCVKVIDEHGFWDYDLNKYVFLRKDASQYIGHWFNKQTTDANGNLVNTRVQLVKVVVQAEYTSAWSPVTYGHLCYYVNGMLSMPGATTGLINIFDVDPDIMKIEEAKYLADIEEYGLFTYEEFASICPIPEEVFEAFGGKYLKVAIGKGLTSIEELETLIARYSQFWETT